MRSDVAEAIHQLEDVDATMRKELEQTIKDLRDKIDNYWANHRDLDMRFRDLVRNQATVDRVLIDFNPINSTYQWSIKPKIFVRDGYSSSSDYGETQPYAEGSSSSYREAVDAIIYHERLNHLGLPTKPNGTTKNY